MSDTPFIKFYPSDFLGGTSGLSPSERGCYITLLCLMYEADGPIQRDDKRLSRRCGAPKAAFSGMLDALIGEGKIVECDGMLYNRRAEKAIVDRTNRTQSGMHAAQQRWAAKSEKDQRNQRPDDAGAMRAQCAGDASQKPEPEVDKKRDTNVSLALVAPERDAQDRFSEFWDQYPHRNGAKKGKEPARKAWAKAIKARASPDQIIGGAMRYATDRQVIDGYAKDPATWINQKGWEDETEQHRANGPSGSGPSRSGNAMVDAFAAVAAERTARNRGS